MTNYRTLLNEKGEVLSIVRELDHGTHTSEISKWKSRVFPGKTLDELSQTLLVSSWEMLLLDWDAG